MQDATSPASPSPAQAGRREHARSPQSQEAQETQSTQEALTAEVVVRADTGSEARSGNATASGTLGSAPEPHQASHHRGSRAVWKPRSALCTGGQSLDLLHRVLRARNMSAPSLASQPETRVQEFLYPSLKYLHDPSLLMNLDVAVQRLLTAARGGERVIIYGDYDVDGVSASAILFHTLRAVAPSCDVQTYVPHRVDEGYGLSSAAIAELCKPAVQGGGGARVIVSVDCGITALEPARVAKEAGVDLIITDHHNFASAGEGCGPAMPEAFALVHPKLPGSSYPFGELCGAGVAFKLAWRLLTTAAGSTRLPDAWRELLLDLLGLCSLGVIADVVPLIDENRVIARFGLRRLRTSRIEGLRALITASGFADESVDEEQVGFQLAPRLNACGRMGHAKEAVELLTTATGPRADELAVQLTQQNEHRRRIERAIFEEACELAEREGMIGTDKRAIVLAKQGWHAGVVGIVCAKLVEKFHRPAILLSEHEGHCHGSGRSVDGVSLHAALADCAAHLTKFGGHDMAAGLQCPSENMAAFTHDFIETINRRLPVDALVAHRGFDCEGRVQDLGLASVQALDLLRPFGRDNPSVCLALHNLRIASRPEHLGSTNKHLAMLVADANQHRGATIRCIAWNFGDLVPTLRFGQTISLLARPKVSTFGGSARVELEVVDIMPAKLTSAALG